MQGGFDGFGGVQSERQLRWSRECRAEFRPFRTSESRPFLGIFLFQLEVSRLRPSMASFIGALAEWALSRWYFLKCVQQIEFFSYSSWSIVLHVSVLCIHIRLRKERPRNSLIAVSKPVHEFLTAFIISVNLHLVTLLYVHHPTLFVFTYAYKKVPPLLFRLVSHRNYSQHRGYDVLYCSSIYKAAPDIALQKKHFTHTPASTQKGTTPNLPPPASPLSSFFLPELIVMFFLCARMHAYFNLDIVARGWGG